MTGILVGRLPPGRECLRSAADEAALAAYLDAIRLAQSIDRYAVRATACAEFATDQVLERVLAALDQGRQL